MKTISFNGTWQLRGRPQDDDTAAPLSLTAQVPGCVQLDLAENGYLPRDLYMGENILQAEAYEDWEWWYDYRFTAPAEREWAVLVFEGVDCLAEYFLNGVKLGESDNMFIAHEFPVSHALQDGENLLTVHLRSAMLAAEQADYDLKVLSGGHNPESRQLRKPPHSFGWDIFPRAVTAGLWREVRLELRDPIRFSQLFFHTKGESVRCYYTLDCGGKSVHGITLTLTGSCGDSRFHVTVPCRQKMGYADISIPSPKLWFPYGYGEANVYDGTASICCQGQTIHEKTFQFGIRDVVLEREDAIGGREGQFRFLINGVPVMCRGSNWVPLDAFHCRDASRYDAALALVKDIGCNILRSWGGGVYEDHKFFDFCDRNGIMIWQDFSMACAFYPETAAFKEKLAKEATAVIRKLRNHPSIILWAGDNEVDACTDLYNPNTNSLTREVLAKCVELNDIGRPYLPSSPYLSPAAYDAGQRSQDPACVLVEDHLWGPRDYFKSDYYKNDKARFVSETGYHGCPDLSSIQKFITPERVWPYQNNPEWILHSSDQNGNDSRVMLMDKQVRQLFGQVPTDPETYILASQISQAEAKKYFIERIRVHRPYTTGIIWWNLLDGWPQMSDAVVDYYFAKKPAYHYIKRSQAPFTIAADELQSWQLPIYACNDTLLEKQGHFSVLDADSGEILYESSFTAAANTSTLLTLLPIYYSERRVLLFRWEINGEQGWNHYLCGYPPFSLEWYRGIMEKHGFRG